MEELINSSLVPKNIAQNLNAVKQISSTDKWGLACLTKHVGYSDSFCCESDCARPARADEET